MCLCGLFMLCQSLPSFACFMYLEGSSSLSCWLKGREVWQEGEVESGGQRAWWEPGGRWQDDTAARFVSEDRVLQRKGWDDIEGGSRVASNAFHAFIWLGRILVISVEYTGACICVEKWRTYMDEHIHEQQREILLLGFFLMNFEPLFCSKEHKTLRLVVQFFVINYCYVISKALCIMLHGTHICHHACFLQYTLLICNTASWLINCL